MNHTGIVSKAAVGLVGICVLLIVVASIKVEAESNVVTEKLPAPSQTTNDSSSQTVSFESLQNQIDSLSFNIRHTEEVLIQWKKNFKMIDQRLTQLEKQMKDVNPSSSSSTVKPEE